MGSEEEGISVTFPEELAPLVESDIVQYISGAIIGGAAGDILRDVVSGIIVEAIVDALLFLGLQDLVYDSPHVTIQQAQTVTVQNDVQQSPFEVIGVIAVSTVFLSALWILFRPRIRWNIADRRQRLLFDAFLAIVTIGILVGIIQQSAIGPSGFNSSRISTTLVTAGSIFGMALSLIVLWKVVWPWISPELETRQERMLFDGSLVIVSTGIIVGGLFGTSSAIVASCVVMASIVTLAKKEIIYTDE